ncbi:hypothetical protein MKEN_00177100 [Mycena kentingensis (nom. inval.)]|nr:hypothetical protein MKEN_00177100 [Mycena kentingensis (nom. inval.)]
MATLAKPFCSDCIKNVQHKGEPVGKEIEIAGVPTYLSEPPASAVVDGAPKNVILFYADVYGPLYINSKLVQDYFAAQGFYVLGIDYFLGDPVSLYQAKECMPRWLEQVRKTYGEDAQYFVAGYCFGALYVMEQAAEEDIVAAAFAHPGMLTEDHFKNIKKPLLMSCAENDFAFELADRRRAEDILISIKAKYHIQVSSGVTHGFALKGDLDNADFRACFHPGYLQCT